MNGPSETEEIERIAYELWQIDGEPFGREDEHWERARRIFESRRASSGDGDGRAPGGPDAPRPIDPGFGEAEPGMVPAADLPDPPTGRFATQVRDLPDERT